MVAMLMGPVVVSIVIRIISVSYLSFILCFRFCLTKIAEPSFGSLLEFKRYVV